MSKKVNDEEISIPELVVKTRNYLRFLKKRQLTIWLWVIAMFIFGVVTVLTTEDEFEATNVVLSYSGAGNNMNNQAASRLAGLAGIQLPTTQGLDSRAVSEMMIPTILNTYPVGRELGSKELRFYNDGVAMTGIEYFSIPPEKTILDHIKSWTIEAPVRFLQWVIVQIAGEPTRVRPPSASGSVPDSLLTPTQSAVVDSAQPKSVREDQPVRREHIFVDQKTSFAITQLISRLTVVVEGNIITITANMPDPYAAADLAQHATDVLMQEIVNFEVRKTEEELEFLMELYEESEAKYYQTLRNLTELQDRLRGITSASANIELTKAGGENEIARQQFGQITLRVEAARIKLKEDTPMFAVLNPVQIPQRAVNANPIGLIIVFIFLGGFLGIGWVTARGVFQAMKAEAESENEG